ncbi:chemotaxis protein CheW [Oryzisolibacter sp. LB2S]|uniref:chemotaxis protein CheW n=1 Tax=Alicycliphilus soli TaxID=3228789 RepID=UPI0034596D32
MNVVDKGVEEMAAGAKEYLSFRLGEEEYGIDILKVQEIRGYEAPTRIAHAPAFIKGVINLRGTIVPIVDMRLRFGCAQAEYNSFTVVIILNLRERVVGIVVDSVSDVLELAPDQLRAAPDMESGMDAQCIRGLGSVGGRMLILLDIERLMSGVDMGIVTAAT